MKIKAKKQFGQNFLKDERVLDKIIESMPINSNKIVEIGPGLGDLTKRLVKCKDVIAYEVDKDLYSILQMKFQNEIKLNRLKIILGDVLDKFKNNETLHTQQYDLVANLPYYIATNILLNCLDDNNCEHIIAMVQKEVADKFVAQCGNRDYSALSVITQLSSYLQEIITIVPPQSFEPQPKVNSAVIYIKKRLDTKIDNEFKKFLKICFSQPRKLLIKNLSTIYSKEILNNIFDILDIKSTIRPHEVCASLYSHIYTRIKNNGRDSNTE
jgi:16S rRNA (adenine1518-N6/adenine1519-N6)-dimethyltransferase